MCGQTTTSLEIGIMFAKKLLWPSPEETASKYFLFVTHRDGGKRGERKSALCKVLYLHYL